MASVATTVQTSNDAKFRLKPLFQHVVRSVEGCSQTQTIFTYEEVWDTSLVAFYNLAFPR